MASITADGTIYVSSLRHCATTVIVDIYRIPLEGGAYKAATDVSKEYNNGGGQAHHLKHPFNTPTRDFPPRFSPEGEYISFFRERRRLVPRVGQAADGY
ncbi:MAG: hypothetical protein ABI446_07650 [Gemmatimonadaceae bacterium]